MHRIRCGLMVLTLQLTMVLGLRAQAPQSVEIDQELVRYAVVRDPKLVKFFVDDFLITESNVERLTIYDLVGDGFGEGDQVRTHPGGKIYMISPGKKAQAMMNNWRFGDNIKFTANATDSPDLFESAPDSVRALGGIFAGLLRSMRRNYRGMPIKLTLEQSDGVTAIEMWGYDQRLLKYTPPPIENREVLKPVYNLIYVEKTIADTVYYGPKQSAKTER
ncbi:hypothetical protein HUU05_25000 [candidate division KSB1 bacterium]|nr:hypothetical protein [candidate division KSB1 bacterium]